MALFSNAYVGVLHLANTWFPFSLAHRGKALMGVLTWELGGQRWVLEGLIWDWRIRCVDGVDVLNWGILKLSANSNIPSVLLRLSA